MAHGDRSDRGRGRILQLAGAQAMLVGCFTSLMGLGFFRLAGLIFGGAALVVLGALAAFIGTRRRHASV